MLLDGQKGGVLVNITEYEYDATKDSPDYLVPRHPGDLTGEQRQAAFAKTSRPYIQDVSYLKLREVNLKDRDAVARATKEGNTEAAATLGFSAAMAAYGGFFIPKSYGSSIALTGGPEAALYVFSVFYLICIAVTWWHYARRNAPMPC